MQKEVGPIEDGEEKLLDAMARALILIAKEFTKVEPNNDETKHPRSNNQD